MADTKEDQEGFLALVQQIKVPKYTFSARQEYKDMMVMCTLKLRSNITVTDPDAFLQRLTKANKGWPKDDDKGQPLHPLQMVDWIVTKDDNEDNLLCFRAHPFLIRHIEEVDNGTVRTSAGNLEVQVGPSGALIP